MNCCVSVVPLLMALANGEDPSGKVNTFWFAQQVPCDYQRCLFHYLEVPIWMLHHLLSSYWARSEVTGEHGLSGMSFLCHL